MKENLDCSCGAETLPSVFDSIFEGYRLIKIINLKFKGGENVLRNCIVNGFIEYGDNEMTEILKNECSKVTDDMNGFRYICKFMVSNQSIKYVVKYMEKAITCCLALPSM